MFNYKSVKNPWVCNHYAKSLRKFFLTYNTFFLAVIDIFIFIILFISLSLNKYFEFNGTLYIISILITILLQGVIFIFTSHREIKKSLSTLTNEELTLSFDEDGIHINSGGILKHIHWDGVRDVRADKETLSLYYKLNGIPNNKFYFSFFETPREEIVKEIEKYMPVRRID